MFERPTGRLRGILQATLKKLQPFCKLRMDGGAAIPIRRHAVPAQDFHQTKRHYSLHAGPKPGPETVQAELEQQRLGKRVATPRDACVPRLPGEQNAMSQPGGRLVEAVNPKKVTGGMQRLVMNFQHSANSLDRRDGRGGNRHVIHIARKLRRRPCKGILIPESPGQITCRIPNRHRRKCCQPPGFRLQQAGGRCRHRTRIEAAAQGSSKSSRLFGGFAVGQGAAKTGSNSFVKHFAEGRDVVFPARELQDRRVFGPPVLAQGELPGCYGEGVGRRQPVNMFADGATTLIGLPANKHLCQVELVHCRRSEFESEERFWVGSKSEYAVVMVIVERCAAEVVTGYE